MDLLKRRMEFEDALFLGAREYPANILSYAWLNYAIFPEAMLSTCHGYGRKAVYQNQPK
jgi:hypothetical protein